MRFWLLIACRSVASAASWASLRGGEPCGTATQDTFLSSNELFLCHFEAQGYDDEGLRRESTSFGVVVVAAQRRALLNSHTRHVSQLLICASHVQPGALHRSAPRGRRRTHDESCQKIHNRHHITFCSLCRCPVCGVSLLSHASVVFVLCVLPWIPRFKIYLFVWREGKSDGLKWCPHKVISAHMLAYTAGNRPWS